LVFYKIIKKHNFCLSQSSGRVLQMIQILVVYIAFIVQLYTYGWFGTDLTR
jgi:hypothetical protein